MEKDSPSDLSPDVSTTLSPQLGSELLELARLAIARRFGAIRAVRATAPELDRPGATFVTLTRRGMLRGCIGSLEARRRLRDDVEENALAAAFRDPRFPPLTAGEFADTRVEVSLLSPPRPLAAASEAEALAAMRPHEDGIIFEYERLRSTFLPQVWETLPDPHDFLAHLRAKAGLPMDFWAPEVRLWRYGVHKWHEAD